MWSEMSQFPRCHIEDFKLLLSKDISFTEEAAELLLLENKVAAKSPKIARKMPFK